MLTTWKYNTMLSALTKPLFKPIREIPLKWLRMKALFLISITSARRILELGALSIKPDICIFHKDRLLLRTDPSFKPKVNSSFYRSQEICIPSNPIHPRAKAWRTLDVRRAIKSNLYRSESIRKTDNAIHKHSPTNAGGKTSTSAIILTIKACITESSKKQAKHPNWLHSTFCKEVPPLMRLLPTLPRERKSVKQIHTHLYPCL